MLSPFPVTLLTPGARAPEGTGVVVPLGACDTLRLHLDVLELAAGASLTVTLETSRDGVVWRALGAFPARTAVGTDDRVFSPADAFVRAAWRGAAGPCSLALGGTRLRPYATLADLRQLGINPSALAGISDEDLERALSAAGATVDSYLAARYERPVVAWGDDVREKTCAIATWLVISRRRGFNPEAGSDVAIRTNYEDAMRWLKDVARFDAEPEGLKDSAPAGDDGSAYVFTEPSRGWNHR